MTKLLTLSPNDVIRMPAYDTQALGHKRVWQVLGVHLGGANQAGTYELVPLDILEHERIHVPCIMLKTHPNLETCN